VSSHANLMHFDIFVDKITSLGQVCENKCLRGFMWKIVENHGFFSNSDTDEKTMAVIDLVQSW